MNRIMVGLLTLACVQSAGAQPEVRALGQLPGGGSSAATAISADGRVVVGASGTSAFRWSSQDGMQTLGTLPFPWSFESVATSVSGDGTVVVGYGTNLLSKGFPTCAFRWTAASGMVPLGPPPVPGTLIGSAANGVSIDGSLIVGYREFSACRWDGADQCSEISGMQDVFGVSGNGLAVVGRSVGRPARWTSEAGVELLGNLPGGAGVNTAGFAWAVSADGTVVVGGSPSSNSAPSGREAFRWTAAAGMVGLGDLTGGYFTSDALAVSSDGTIVVGESSADTAGPTAFIWDEQHGMRPLRTYSSTSTD
ncbi:MAG: PEP-CTERM sorting domain-containing protein [Vicinamibacterales bacterium]